MKSLRSGDRSLRKQVLLWYLAVSALLLVGAGSASAAGHVFDPVLSLTGGCTISSADPVKDPSCPEETPSKSFTVPRGVATDSYGNIYVASYGQEVAAGEEGRIDIFDSEGFFLEEIKDPNGPKFLAIDSEGNLYVFEFHSPTESSPKVQRVVRYKPAPGYDPAAGEISYEEPPVVVTETGLTPQTGIAVNPANDHLFVNEANLIAEFSSAKEGNTLLDETIGKGVMSNFNGLGIAIDAAHKRIYASDKQKVRVFNLEAPHELLLTIEGSARPGGATFSLELAVAADEGTGHFFIYDSEGTNLVYEFAEDGTYLATIEHGFQPVFGGQIAVDNGKESPNGAKNPDGRYLYVLSGTGSPGHSFAFGPEQTAKAPKVESLSFQNVTEAEAELLATINPGHLETTYSFEYETKEAFEETGDFTGAQLAGSGSIPAGGFPVEVSAAAEGLQPGVSYVFQVVAENAEGSDQAEGEFATYPVSEAQSCPNAVFRTGASVLLPDCRAYELVTPPDTNARTPLQVGHLGGGYFATREAAPDGNAASFEIEGGSIPGFEATGSYAGDPYLSRRTETGWTTEYAGPTGEESPALLPGSNSPDQGYVFWSTGSDEGSAAVGGSLTSYLRYPDGHFELVGRGAIATDPRAQGLLISENASHVLFQSGTVRDNCEGAVQLEENAPTDGTCAIYDRTIDSVTGEEQTHVVSLLPEDETPPDGENAFYQGASLDGKGVAFRFGPSTTPASAFYLRYNNEETYEIAPAGATFAGIAEGGKRVFYVEGGNLFAFDVELAEAEEGPIQFSSSGNVTPVNVAAGGTVAYFVSPSVLVSEPNPAGDLPVGGEQNLYRSEEGILSFVGTVTERDVKGEDNTVEIVDGLGLWTAAVGGQFGKDPSRTTPDGQALLFSSRAPLTGYDSEGHPEIYRYDLEGNELDCISCNPTLTPATGNASLQSISREQGAPEPGSSFVLMNNLRADGNRAIFQSSEALVLGDTDGLQDVYEWEADGVGSCKEAGGCVYLISSGHSKRIDYLWAVSDSGDNVFFRSADLLTGSDQDETPSIYDARVGGGFAEPAEEECQAEGCRPGVTPAPGLELPAAPALGSDDNVSSPPVHCPKGKRKVHRNGKTVCVKKKHHKKHHRRAATKRKGAGK